jgi:hypothetical protein
MESELETYKLNMRETDRIGKWIEKEYQETELKLKRGCALTGNDSIQ